MKHYRVRVTATAAEAIERHAHFIAHEQHALGSARRWLEAIWDAVHSLHALPNRARLAEEDASVDYVVRRLVVFQHILLFTVDEERSTVFVIGVRHGHRLPRPKELPQSQSELVLGEE